MDADSNSSGREDGGAAGTGSAGTATRESSPPATGPSGENNTIKTGEAPDRSPGNGNGNGRENQVVHTQSISIKDALKGARRKIPVKDGEIGEDDQVVKKSDAEDKPPVFSKEEITRHWNAYAESLKESRPRIYNTLVENQPEVTDEGVIRIELTSNAQRENFIQRIKPGIIGYLRSHLADVEYDIESLVKQQENNNLKTVYTDQDKLEYLARKNPVLEKFRKNLKLDFDD